MLEIRPTCEHCNKKLPFDSEEAFICTFECTFCVDCANELLKGVCPNCEGNFEKRPIRPKHLLNTYPISEKVVHKPVNLLIHEKRLKDLLNRS